MAQAEGQQPSRRRRSSSEHADAASRVACTALPKRSKNGCNTCRSKKVKCDEKRPNCSRCLRLVLNCQWLPARPPLRERRQAERRQREQIRLSGSGSQSPLLPRTPQPDKTLQNASPSASRSPLLQTAASSLPILNGDLEAFGLSNQGPATRQQDNPQISSIPSNVIGTLPAVIDEASLLQGTAGHSTGLNLGLEDGFNLCMEQPIFGDDPPQVFSSSSPESTMPSWEAFCAPWPTSFGDFGSQLAFPTSVALPSPSPLHYALSMPCSVPLTALEHRALDHYSTLFSVNFTKKHPRWSTLSLIRIMGLTDPMVMHFLLAVAFNDMWWGGGQTQRELQVAAQEHYRSGASLLAETRNRLGVADAQSKITAEQHSHLMAAFWFLYLYRTRMPDVDVNFLRHLSTAVTEHIRKYGLDSLCSSGGYEIQGRPGGIDGHSEKNISDHTAPSWSDHRLLTCSAREGSMIALLITCLYYQDIRYGFYHCGGKLATHLNVNKERLGRIYDLGRNALALNWGPDYPINEMIDDSENYAMLKFNSELNILLEDINCEFVQTRPDPEAKRRFQLELDVLRIKYANVLDMSAHIEASDSVPKSFGERPREYNSASEGRGQSRTQVNADLSTAYFHAVRVYLFRCTLEDAAMPAPEEVASSQRTVLTIAGSVLGHRTRHGQPDSPADVKDQGLFHRLEWPLFVVGAESMDVIYQDWVVHKMQKKGTKRALQQIIVEQERTGRRVGVEYMRQVFLQKL